MDPNFYPTHQNGPKFPDEGSDKPEGEEGGRGRNSYGIMSRNWWCSSIVTGALRSSTWKTKKCERKKEKGETTTLWIYCIIGGGCCLVVASPKDLKQSKNHKRGRGKKNHLKN
ncbi:hypothetical protein HAX54_045459 [Datura stramonium]|uniref:Transmembrane protein n=1 Tax=Datura stramonium TaxID=4076 RepID=A0ABS8WHL9_DATST|nr:hypothetical protein [Datura stramonium]